MAQAPAFSAASLAIPAPPAWADEVRAGLLRTGQKTLPCKLLYDAVGSTLFEAICALPEYGLAAADARLLRTHAEAMVAGLGEGVLVAELGSGNGRKTRWLLEALCRRQFTLYAPIEISPLAMARSQAELSPIHGLEIRPVALEYLPGLTALAQFRATAAGRGRPLLLLFLGSSLGNFERAEAAAFLRAVHARLQPGDRLLLGLDLLKPVGTLRLAYDDPGGITAAFNRHLLVRLNRELGADFDLRQWQHRIVWDRQERRIEMHLRSRRDQRVRLPPWERPLTFQRGETIWSESSHKYRLEEIPPLLAGAGFRIERQWRDHDWPFAETLSVAE